MKKSSRKNKVWKGFTLVEMLIVLLIIGLLVLIFIPNLGETRNTADRTSRSAIVKVVETQIELYMFDNPNVDKPSSQDLVDGNYITSEQKAIYDEYKKEEK